MPGVCGTPAPAAVGRAREGAAAGTGTGLRAEPPGCRARLGAHGHAAQCDRSGSASAGLLPGTQQGGQGRGTPLQARGIRRLRSPRPPSSGPAWHGSWQRLVRGLPPGDVPITLWPAERPRSSPPPLPETLPGDGRAFNPLPVPVVTVTKAWQTHGIQSPVIKCPSWWPPREQGDDRVNQ